MSRVEDGSFTSSFQSGGTTTHEIASNVSRVSPRISNVLSRCRALFAQARRHGLCNQAASMYAVSSSPHEPQYTISDHLDIHGNKCNCAQSAHLPSDALQTETTHLEHHTAGKLPDDLEQLRSQLALLGDDKEKMSVCQDRLLSHYKWKKMMELEESVKSLFKLQYTRTRWSNSDETNDATDNNEEELLGCPHYARNCKIKADCCGLYVGCRFCHDEALSEDHEMDRFATTEILCMNCLTEQPISESCVECGIRFAHYYCESCRFFENTPGKKVYHCDQCNICRLGSGLGIDNYHCDKCDACVSLQSKEHHNCMSKALHTNCPVCYGYLFTSRQPVVFMQCGHTMHKACFEQHTARRYQCPLCLRSLTDMTKYFEEIDELLEKEPMPSEYDHKRSSIRCNDCGAKSVTKFHFLYHKCSSCSGYNTKVFTVFDVAPNLNTTTLAEQDVLTALSAIRGMRLDVALSTVGESKEQRGAGVDILRYSETESRTEADCAVWMGMREQAFHMN